MFFISPDLFLKYMYSFLARGPLQVASHYAFQGYLQQPRPQQEESPPGVLSLCCPLKVETLSAKLSFWCLED